MNTTMSSAPTTRRVDTLTKENDGDLSKGDGSRREAITAVGDNSAIAFTNQLATK